MTDTPDTVDDTPVVAREHAVYFGLIVNLFAKIEAQMLVAAAGFLRSDLATAHVLLADTTAHVKRQTLRHLNATVGIDGAPSAALDELIAEFRREAKLRNWIAHAPWTRGRRAGAIRPLPLYVRREKSDSYGPEQSAPEYTAVDLAEATDRLAKLNAQFEIFLDTSGLKEKVAARRGDDDGGAE